MTHSRCLLLVLTICGLFTMCATSDRHRGFRCNGCGEWHAELPLAWSTPPPGAYLAVPEAERATRCQISDELCTVDDKHHFVRGLVSIPIHDAEEVLAYEAWVSLSKPNYERMLDEWNRPGRENAPAMFGWLSSRLPHYPETLNLKTMVHTQPIGLRPEIELEPTDHPLAVEQKNGITWARAEEIAATLLHAGSK